MTTQQSLARHRVGSDVRVRALLIVSTVLALPGFVLWAYIGFIVVVFADTPESASRIGLTMAVFGALLVSLVGSSILAWLFYRQHRTTLAVAFALWPVVLTLLPIFIIILFRAFSQ